MAAKKASLATQIRNERAEAFAVKQKLEKTEKELESSKQSNKYNSDRAQKAEAELEQVHMFLDAVPNPPARKSENAGGYGHTEHSLMTRMSVYLTTRNP
jgi:hypothetical protein